jgi:hypothetical protein
VIETPLPADDSVAARVREALELAKQEANKDLAVLNAYRESLEPEKRRLESALKTFNQHAQTARSTSNRLRAFRG